MFPVLFGFIKSYGFMLAVSFMVGMWVATRRGRKYNLPSETIVDVIFAILVSSIVGVRLFFVVTHLDDFHPWYRAFYIWDGGLTLYGGIATATAAVWWMCRRRKIPFLVMADIIAPTVMLGLGFTRIGCFMAGCCHGKPTACSYGVVFPPGSPADKIYGAVAVHPAQLYSSLGGFLLFGLLLLTEKWSHFRGATFGRFLAFYGMLRFVLDFTRYYQPGQVMMFGWSNNQWISVGLMIAGTFVLVLGSAGKLGGQWKREKIHG